MIGKDSVSTLVYRIKELKKEKRLHNEVENIKCRYYKMKFLFIILLLGINYSFAEERNSLEERVTALEQKISEPIILSECFIVPTTVKAAWVIHAPTTPTSDGGETTSTLRYNKMLSIPYQKVQKILVNSQIYSRILNDLFTLVVNYSEEDNETSKIINIANSELKDQVEWYVLCKTHF